MEDLKMAKLTRIVALKAIIATLENNTNNDIINGYKNADIIAVLDKMVNTIENKNVTTSTKKTLVQTDENKLVLGVLTNAPMTVTEILKTGNLPEEYSCSKVTAILRRLVTDGKAVNIKEGKKSLYMLA